jgi:hypothetical protein
MPVSRPFCWLSLHETHSFAEQKPLLQSVPCSQLAPSGQRAQSGLLPPQSALVSEPFSKSSAQLGG